ncbi:MAG TPA: TerB family tellurite resistance protein [Candidatus Marinimicrobia bacterium]|jgi:DnaJ like chaperone protein|nr:TerB family tellurite resistance protein [Candidatus Neomarinimicrobiota bacterium]MDP7512128.1 TerB family tellurite resistance protein [Candidatus Neomarinimicrobiota bacterium]HJM12113.1 TerB family tellurite resistance protein [Candidatus Neomarinimicrobiota bacterium]|tara:strand:- start:11108 stop:11839 length:732 start_codon:yes stop_codon:yes gene_type:complete
MSVSKKILFGGLGWALAGPIGAIIGYYLASSGDYSGQRTFGSATQNYSSTKPGDFMVSLLVLLGAVMKADKQLQKSELDYVKQFLRQQFSHQNTQEYMTLFKDIIKQDYPIRDVCRQIQRSMDHPSRLELIHVLFGLSQADGHVHPDEISIIHTIARYLNINEHDFDSIKAMFVKDTHSAYKVLEIENSATDSEVKKAYRKMASKYHPDKVNHLGEDLKHLAEEKFKAVNDAYQNIKKERGMS